MAAGYRTTVRTAEVNGSLLRKRIEVAARIDELRGAIMPSTELLRSELTHYLILAEELKAQYGDIDDETLRDTLEGISELPDVIKEVVRSSLDDETMMSALKARVEDMQARLDRFKLRAEKKRDLICWAMGHAGIDRLNAEDFSVSLRHGPQRLEIIDEAQIPCEYLVPLSPRLDRTALLSTLKQGAIVPGVILAYGQPHISVRVR